MNFDPFDLIVVSIAQPDTCDITIALYNRLEWDLDDITVIQRSD